MSRWTDPAIVARTRKGWASVSLRTAVREAKRAEAGQRNAVTPHEATRAHRQGRCDCTRLLSPVPSLTRRRHKSRTCPWPSKVAYATPQEAAWTQGKHSKRRRWAQGLNVYRCPSGQHWHAGRLFDRVSAWARAA